MRHRSTSARTLWLIAATLQLALPGADAWADARLQREAALSPQAASHVESHRTDQCARSHPPDCAVCRHLSTPIALAPEHSAWPQTSNHAPIVPACAPTPRALTFGVHPSRAPPLS